MSFYFHVSSIFKKICFLHYSNPLVPSQTLKSHMLGKKFLRLSTLNNRINTSDTQSDWVTIGVVISKSDAKVSQKVRFFCACRKKYYLKKYYNSVERYILYKYHCKK